MRDSAESPRLSYILPEDTRQKSICSCNCNPSNEGRIRRLLSIALYSLWILVVILTVLLVYGWWTGKSAVREWDTTKMERLQPVLLEQVRTLLVTANRSIHDPHARQLLRNLAKEDPDTCYTPNCLHTGLTLLESMNFSVDPCDDFYEFSCGSWTHSTGDDSQTAPSGVLINSDQFSKINEKVIKATQNILQSPAAETDLQAFSYARQFYYQCKDLDQLEEDGLEPLWELIYNYGGWPILGDSFRWNKTFDWITLTGDLQRLSNPSILSLEAKQHPTNPLTNIIYIVHPKFFMSREYLISPDKYPRLITAYKDFIIGIATEFVKFGGGTVNPELLATQADEIIRFESALALLAVHDESNMGKVGRRALYSIQKLQLEANFMTPKNNPKSNTTINWLKFIQRVFLSSGISISDEEIVVLHEVSFVRLINPLLASTSPQTLANYLMWRLLAKFTTGATVALRELNFKFYNIVFGMKKVPPRASTCATVVKDAFALAIGMKIVKGLTDLSSKREVEEIVDNVRDSMEDLLDTQEIGLKLLLIGINRKLSTLKHCIGYPSSFQNTSAIDHFYRTLDFRDEKEVYLKKYIRLRYWLYDKSLVSLRLPFDSDCWSGTSWANIGEAYAYYDTARNSINFPIGLLQSPFYRHNVPSSVNYGAIGAIIGHEISHSINFEGWIKVGLVRELEEYWECLLHHYSNYEVPELGPDSRVNGLRTRSENLADHLGLAASYWAYQRLSKSNEKSHQKTLVGLDLFTPNQLFFLSFSHMWCVSGPEEWLADELESSSHTPGRYRVLGSLQNSENFAQTWSCPSGSPMNPKDKCNTLITAVPSTQKGKWKIEK